MREDNREVSLSESVKKRTTVVPSGTETKNRDERENRGVDLEK